MVHKEAGGDEGRCGGDISRGISTSNSLKNLKNFIWWR